MRGGVRERVSAFVRDTFERAHPLIRLSYLPRFVAWSFWTATTLKLEGRERIFWDNTWPVLGFLVPHLWFWGPALVWNTKRAGSLAMLFDSALTGFPVGLYYSSRTLPVVSLFVITTNAISVGGLRFLATNLAVVATSTTAVWWFITRHHPLARLGDLADAVQTLVLALYMCLSAFSMRAQAQRINAMRRELASSNDLLEARVQERTAALASTNAAISRFVPLEFLSALGHADVTTAKLGDVASREVTVLFADIRNFTAMSERLSPEATFRFLNECLSRMGPHIRAQSGFVDKYIGDAIMALFPGSPADAVRAALAMQAELRAYNAAHPSETPLAIGVGIHVGQVMMGTIGEAQRFEATVISDAVNLTARLETLTKQLGCTILVSDAVAAHLSEGERSCTRPLGTFAVKGKSEPVAIVEIFASDDVALREAKRASMPSLARALAYYTQDELVEALTLVGALAEACPDDGPMQWWLRRMQRELTEGGPASGHRIVRLDEK